VLLEVVSNAFDSDVYHIKEGHLLPPRAMSMGRSDAGEELNGCDGHTPEGSNDDMMNVIKDHITSLIRKWAPLNRVVFVINCNRGS